MKHRQQMSKSGIRGREMDDRKILVAYFSCTDHTQNVAKEIAEAVSGTLFEIRTVNDYPESYAGKIAVGGKEKLTGSRPEILNTVADMDLYDTVMVGFPVWFSTCPMAILSFLEEYDMTGKTIYPFYTSGGGSGSRAIRDIEKSAPYADVMMCYNASKYGTSALEKWME